MKVRTLLLAACVPATAVLGFVAWTVADTVGAMTAVRLPGLHPDRDRDLPAPPGLLETMRAFREPWIGMTADTLVHYTPHDGGDPVTTVGDILCDRQGYTSDGIGDIRHLFASEQTFADKLPNGAAWWRYHVYAKTRDGTYLPETRPRLGFHTCPLALLELELGAVWHTVVAQAEDGGGTVRLSHPDLADPTARIPVGHIDLDVSPDGQVRTIHITHARGTIRHELRNVRTW